MRYSRDQLLEIQPSTPNFELVNRLRELRLGVGHPRKRGCRGRKKKLRSIQVVPSRNLHPLMVPPFLQPHPDLQSAVGNAPLSSKHPTHLPTTDCLLSITPLMGGQPSDAPALSPPSPLQQGGQSSNAPALSPPSPLPQGSQPIALALSPSSPLPQDGQPSDAPRLSPSSSTLLLCPSYSTLSICHLNSQSAVKTVLEVEWDGDKLATSEEEGVDTEVKVYPTKVKDEKGSDCEEIIKRFSSLDRLLRVAARLLSWLRQARKKRTKQEMLVPSSSESQDLAFKQIIIGVQAQHFPLSQRSTHHELRRLDVFTDHQGSRVSTKKIGGKSPWTERWAVIQTPPGYAGFPD
ncbi:hypothetical protein ACOMHN_008128 [Nucella lapillus]